MSFLSAFKFKTKATQGIFGDASYGFIESCSLPSTTSYSCRRRDAIFITILSQIKKNKFMVVSKRVLEVPLGTVFAMQRNFTLLCRLNSTLCNQIVQLHYQGSQVSQSIFQQKPIYN
jgi:hypothetical protein